MTIKFKPLDRKKLLLLHSEIQWRLKQVRPGEDNSKLKAECNQITAQIAAINSKYRSGAQA